MALVARRIWTPEPPLEPTGSEMSLLRDKRYGSWKAAVGLGPLRKST